MASSSTSSSEKCVVSSLVDTWLSEACNRDAQTLIRALQTSLIPTNSSDSGPYNNHTALVNATAVDRHINPTAAPVNNHNAAVAAQKGEGGAVGGPRGGRVVKRRKSRASTKRSNTTFIAADPAHFREMVQQVTGGGDHHRVLPLVLKPEPQRLGATGRLGGGGGVGGGGGGGCGALPTLDTSAFLVSPTSVNSSGGGPGLGPSTGPIENQMGSFVGDFGVGFDFMESLATNYPTLDSFKVVM